MRKQINIYESYLTDEKINRCYYYEPEKGIEGHKIPDWYFKTVRDLAEDATFTSMIIQLEHALGGLKREIEIRVYWI